MMRPPNQRRNVGSIMHMVSEMVKVARATILARYPPNLVGNRIQCDGMIVSSQGMMKMSIPAQHEGGSRRAKQNGLGGDDDIVVVIGVRVGSDLYDGGG